MMDDFDTFQGVGPSGHGRGQSQMAGQALHISVPGASFPATQLQSSSGQGQMFDIMQQQQQQQQQHQQQQHQQFLMQQSLQGQASMNMQGQMQGVQGYGMNMQGQLAQGQWQQGSIGQGQFGSGQWVGSTQAPGYVQQGQGQPNPAQPSQMFTEQQQGQVYMGQQSNQMGWVQGHGQGQFQGPRERAGSAHNQSNTSQQKSAQPEKPKPKFTPADFARKKKTDAFSQLDSFKTTAKKEQGPSGNLAAKGHSVGLGVEANGVIHMDPRMNSGGMIGAVEVPPVGGQQMMEMQYNNQFQHGGQMVAPKVGVQQFTQTNGQHVAAVGTEFLATTQGSYPTQFVTSDAELSGSSVSNPSVIGGPVSSALLGNIGVKDTLGLAGGPMVPTVPPNQPYFQGQSSLGTSLPFGVTQPLVANSSQNNEEDDDFADFQSVPSVSGATISVAPPSGTQTPSVTNPSVRPSSMLPLATPRNTKLSSGGASLTEGLRVGMIVKQGSPDFTEPIFTKGSSTHLRDADLRFRLGGSESVDTTSNVATASVTSSGLQDLQDRHDHIGDPFGEFSSRDNVQSKFGAPGHVTLPGAAIGSTNEASEERNFANFADFQSSTAQGSSAPNTEPTTTDTSLPHSHSSQLPSGLGEVESATTGRVVNWDTLAGDFGGDTVSSETSGVADPQMAVASQDESFGDFSGFEGASTGKDKFAAFHSGTADPPLSMGPDGGVFQANFGNPSPVGSEACTAPSTTEVSGAGSGSFSSTRPGSQSLVSGSSLKSLPETNFASFPIAIGARKLSTLEAVVPPTDSVPMSSESHSAFDLLGSKGQSDRKPGSDGFADFLSAGGLKLPVSDAKISITPPLVTAPIVKSKDQSTEQTRTPDTPDEFGDFSAFETGSNSAAAPKPINSFKNAGQTLSLPFSKPGQSDDTKDSCAVDGDDLMLPEDSIDKYAYFSDVAEARSSIFDQHTSNPSPVFGKTGVQDNGNLPASAAEPESLFDKEVVFPAISSSHVDNSKSAEDTGFGDFNAFEHMPPSATALATDDEFADFASFGNAPTVILTDRTNSTQIPAVSESSEFAPFEKPAVGTHTALVDSVVSSIDDDDFAEFTSHPPASLSNIGEGAPVKDSLEFANFSAFQGTVLGGSVEPMPTQTETRTPHIAALPSLDLPTYFESTGIASESMGDNEVMVNTVQWDPALDLKGTSSLNSSSEVDTSTNALLSGDKQSVGSFASTPTISSSITSLSGTSGLQAPKIDWGSVVANTDESAPSETDTLRPPSDSSLLSPISPPPDDGCGDGDDDDFPAFQSFETPVLPPQSREQIEVFQSEEPAVMSRERSEERPTKSLTKQDSFDSFVGPPSDDDYLDGADSDADDTEGPPADDYFPNSGAISPTVPEASESLLPGNGNGKSLKPGDNQETGSSNETASGNVGLGINVDESILSEDFDQVRRAGIAVVRSTPDTFSVLSKASSGSDWSFNHGAQAGLAVTEEDTRSKDIEIQSDDSPRSPESCGSPIATSPPLDDDDDNDDDDGDGVNRRGTLLSGGNWRSLSPSVESPPTIPSDREHSRESSAEPDDSTESKVMINKSNESKVSANDTSRSKLISGETATPSPPSFGLFSPVTPPPSGESSSLMNSFNPPRAASSSCSSPVSVSAGRESDTLEPRYLNLQDDDDDDDAADDADGREEDDNADEWGFHSSVSPPVPSANDNASEVKDDEWSAFPSAGPSTIDPPSDDSHVDWTSTVLPSNSVTSPHVKPSSSEGIEEDGFGDFESIRSPGAQPPNLTKTTDPAGWTTTGHSKSDSEGFGDFGNFSGTAPSQGGGKKGSDAQDGEDWAFESSPPPAASTTASGPSARVAGGGGHDDDDEFGDFGDSSALAASVPMASLPAATPQSSQTISYSKLVSVLTSAFTAPIQPEGICTSNLLSRLVDSSPLWARLSDLDTSGSQQFHWKASTCCSELMAAVSIITLPVFQVPFGNSTSFLTPSPFVQPSAQPLIPSSVGLTNAVEPKQALISTTPSPPSTSAASEFGVFSGVQPSLLSSSTPASSAVVEPSGIVTGASSGTVPLDLDLSFFESSSRATVASVLEVKPNRGNSSSFDELERALFGSAASSASPKLDATPSVTALPGMTGQLHFPLSSKK